jgi:Glycosyl transferases group 1
VTDFAGKLPEPAECADAWQSVEQPATSSRQDRPRFLLAQRNCVEYYPPVLHQAKLLHAIGRVTILDAITARDSQSVLTAPNILRLRVRKPEHIYPRLPNSISQMEWLWQYGAEFRASMKSAPDIAVAYEPEAAALLLATKRIAKRTMRVVHLHETPLPDAYAASRTGALALRYMLRTLHHADMVIVPDAQRAEMVHSVARLTSMPFVVMNCPPLLHKIPDSLLLPVLRATGFNSSRIVHYQGSVGPDHGLEAVIGSIRHWPADSIFVIVGKSSQGYVASLKALAAANGVGDRVLVIPRVPYDKVLQYAVGATVGVTLLNPEHGNWDMSSGASNKRFEYCALGMPQVTNDSTENRRLFGVRGIASLVRYGDISAIGRVISKYLEDADLTRSAGIRARKAHLEMYNYEGQFSDALAFMMNWIDIEKARQR